MWSDVMYVRNIETISDLDDKQLLKLSILAFLYGSPDLTHYCLAKFDEKNNTNLINLLRKL